jgi:HEAT repeat protein
VEALLHAVKFNDLARRSGFANFVNQMGVKDDSAGVIASVVKWFVRLIALVVAFDTLGLPAVSNVLNQLLLWLPNLVVALVVLVIGGLAANALSRLVRGAAAWALRKLGGAEATEALRRRLEVEDDETVRDELTGAGSSGALAQKRRTS